MGLISVFVEINNPGLCSIMQDLDNDNDGDNKQQFLDDEPTTGWQSVEIDTRPVDINDEEHAALEEEPIITSGTIGALQLAQKKGEITQQILSC